MVDVVESSHGLEEIERQLLWDKVILSFVSCNWIIPDFRQVGQSILGGFDDHTVICDYSGFFMIQNNFFDVVYYIA